MQAPSSYDPSSHFTTHHHPQRPHCQRPRSISSSPFHQPPPLTSLSTSIPYAGSTASTRYHAPSTPTSPHHHTHASSKRSSLFLQSFFSAATPATMSAPLSSGSSSSGSAGVTSPPLAMPAGQGSQMSSAAYTTQVRLRNDLLALMNNEASADVTVVVGDDRVEFRSHRIMLMARSDYFRRLFSSGAGKQDERVMLVNLDPDAFRIVRRFLYTAEEEDEATSPTTDDWRLVLEAYRVTEFLGVHERSPAYQTCFVAIFERFAVELQDRETCREMWGMASGYGLDNLMVGCAGAFWRVFGTGSFGGGGGGVGGEDLRTLLGGRLETLIKVVNAVPPHLETPIGRFRLVRSWIMGMRDAAALADGGDAVDVYRKKLGRRRGQAAVDGFTTPVDVSPENADPPGHLDMAPLEAGLEEGEYFVGVDGEAEEDEEVDEDEELDEDEEFEDEDDDAYDPYDEETASVPASGGPNPATGFHHVVPLHPSTPSPPPHGHASRPHGSSRKRESYLSTSTAATFVSTQSHITTATMAPAGRALKHRASVEGLGGDGGVLRRRGTQGSLRSSTGGARTASATPSAFVSPTSGSFPAGGDAAEEEAPVVGQDAEGALDLATTPTPERVGTRAAAAKVGRGAGRPTSMIVTREESARLAGMVSPRRLSAAVSGRQVGRRTAAAAAGGQRPASRSTAAGGAVGRWAGTGGRGRQVAGGEERRRSTTPRFKVLASLDLTGITAQDLVEEVEPSGLLSDRHLLTLYRAAALQRETVGGPFADRGGVGGSVASLTGSTTSLVGGGSTASSVAAATAWMPLPCGLGGKRFLTPNPKAGPGSLSIAAGQRPMALEALEAALSSSPSSLAGGALLAALSVTYCASEPLRSSGVYMWTIVPTARERLVGIGVSADATMGSGASAAGSSDVLGGRGEKGGLTSRFSFLGAALGSVGEALKNTFAGSSAPASQVGAPAGHHHHHQRPPSRSGTPENIETNGFYPPLPAAGGFNSTQPYLPPLSTAPPSSHRGSIGGAWMDAAPPSPTMDPEDVDAWRAPSPAPTAVSSSTAAAYPPFPLRAPNSMESLRDGAAPFHPALPHHLQHPGDVPFPPLPHGIEAPYPYPSATPPPMPPASTASAGRGPAVPPMAKFVGEDGGWSLWSDGSLRVGKIFVGRLPRGVTFQRGTPVTVKVDMDAKTVAFEVGGVDCGVAFRNIPSGVFPSVVLGDGAAVSVTRITKVA
ncbi:hypothetical protein HDU96_007164 [Phlyctochytrium bullatum]|nr:hypothetical protein HDU96_007164 [Phlyctochytrium bullatum]